MQTQNIWATYTSTRSLMQINEYITVSTRLPLDRADRPPRAPMPSGRKKMTEMEIENVD